MEFREDAADVLLARLFRQLQLGTDLFVGETAGDEAYDIGFAGGQVADRGTGGGGFLAAFEHAVRDARIDVGRTGGEHAVVAAESMRSSLHSMDRNRSSASPVGANVGEPAA